MSLGKQCVSVLLWPLIPSSQVLASPSAICSITNGSHYTFPPQLQASVHLGVAALSFVNPSSFRQNVRAIFEKCSDATSGHHLPTSPFSFMFKFRCGGAAGGHHFFPPSPLGFRAMVSTCGSAASNHHFLPPRLYVQGQQVWRCWWRPSYPPCLTPRLDGV